MKLSLFAPALLWAFARADLYEINILANNIPDVVEEQLMAQKMDFVAKFEAKAGPGFSYIEPGGEVIKHGGNRALFLRGNDERDLQISQCPNNCERPKNWKLCIKLGCECTCGGRLLQVATGQLSPSDEQDIRADMDDKLRDMCEGYPGCVMKSEIKHIEL